MGTGVAPRDNQIQFDSPSVIIRNGRLVVLNWETEDLDTVAFFQSKPQGGWPAVLERVVKIGVEASRAAGTTERIDYVQKEFVDLQNRFANQLEKTLTGLQEKFDEAFGNKGQFSKIVDDTFGENGKVLKEIFDPSRRSLRKTALRICRYRMEEFETIRYLLPGAAPAKG